MLQIRTFFLALFIAVPLQSIAGTDADALLQQSKREPAQVLESFINGEEYKVAVLCFKTGERTSGMNKICYYDCLGSASAITISSVSLCPLSINQ